MATAIEIVRFDVAPERHATLVAGHADARRAIAAVAPPGALWSRLARLGGKGWIEIVAWASADTFERALDRSSADPVASAWFDLADPGWIILLGELAEGSARRPPRDGALELSWTSGADHESADASGSGEEVWSVRVEIGGRAWIEPSGWVTREPGVLRVAAAPGGEDGLAVSDASDSGPEVARIASAIDSADGESSGS